MPYLKLTLRLALRQGKTYILLSIYRGCLCRGLFTYLYFTNISVRCNAIKIPVLFALLYIRFLTPLYSKIYYKEENYLKVKTIVFKYITPPYSKG